MAVVVLKVITLIFQRVERLIFDLPPRPATAHEGIHVAGTHPQVRHPTEVLHLRIAYFPVLEEVDPYVRVRSIAWPVMDKAKPMTDACGAIVPLIKSHAPIVLGSLHLVEHIGAIAFFASKDLVPPVIV